MIRIVLFLIVFLPVRLWSQSIIIKGQMFDDSTNAAIPFSTVAVKEKGVGVASGINGIFSLALKDYSENDSLEFQALGYKRYCILLDDFLENEVNGTNTKVKLTAVSYYLSEIEVYPTKEEEIFGALSNSTVGPAYSYLPGSQVAIFIPNEKGEKGTIKSVSYFFTGKKRKPTAPFRIRIFESDESGYPGRDLLLKSIIVNAPKADEWFTVNLDKYNLPFPEKGYFAGLELIYTDKKYQFKTKTPNHLNGYKLEKVVYQGPSLGMYTTKALSYRWTGKLGNGWRKFTYKDKDGYSRNYMIRSTVRHQE
jgi:hypothetical protein